MRIEPDLEEDHRDARKLFLRYDDHPIDMMDSLSSAIMDRLGLNDALVFDRDFVTHGSTYHP